MHLPFKFNTRGITLTLAALTLASVHVARAYPMPTPEGSLELRSADSEWQAVALGPRDDLTSEPASELHARFYNPAFELVARDDADSESELHARFYLEARDDDPDTVEDDAVNDHSSLSRRWPEGGKTSGKRPPSSNPGISESNYGTSGGSTRPKAPPKSVRFGPGTIGGAGFPGSSGYSSGSSGSGQRSSSQKSKRGPSGKRPPSSNPGISESNYGTSGGSTRPKAPPKSVRFGPGTIGGAGFPGRETGSYGQAGSQRGGQSGGYYSGSQSYQNRG
ncbi:hypothetical protein K474DRAFT_1662509 [Panus rudis PR-1116 ss-1]|nr:hypothetical protein K474DRAFT_1662509 [Panus rudis PR-1116 ss-1]